MNKLDPFDGDDDGSDGEVAPPTSVTETVHTLQQDNSQEQVLEISNVFVLCKLSMIVFTEFAF